MGIQVTHYFSRISKIERPTRIKSEYSYRITLEGIPPYNIGGFLGLLMAEKVEQYVPGRIGSITADSTLITVDTTFITADSFIIPGTWDEVDITRGEHFIREAKEPSYYLEFEITRKEITGVSSVYQKSLKLYLGDVLCDMDDDEVVPVNKQVNDIAEMQDRQSDFTSQFRIRKTRAMKSLFELSGEVGINTSFPYQQQSCKLIQDNIEVITGGIMILDRVDDQYYYVSILSGNKSFFKTIERLKITDLTLASTNHTWNVATMVNTHTNDLDYVYPLCEPSDDGGIAPLTDDGDRVEMYGGWIWPFIKVKAIWDEIFTNAGYFCEGNILLSDIFLKLFMPINNLALSNININPWLYSLRAVNRQVMTNPLNPLNCFQAQVQTITGDIIFTTFGLYITRFAGQHTFRVNLRATSGGYVIPLHVYVYSAAVQVAEMEDDGTYTPNVFGRAYRATYTALAGENITFWVTTTGLAWYELQVINIVSLQINYSSLVEPRIHLPDLSQVEFIKMICNMFGLIPEAIPRDRKIRFWNYSELYNNVTIARDWSAYLSERDDETEFKFGDYAQDNFLHYRESDDVIKDNGRGSMQVEDDTLPAEKDTVELPLSTCDEVTILSNIFSVNISRLAFNKWNAEDAVYDQEKSIDARIVYIDRTQSVASPPYEKTFGLRATVAPAAATNIDSPKKASSIEVSFSYLVVNTGDFGYAGLSRLLTKTTLRRAKFNLPVYEVAGFKHYIPIYLSQYKAYFYVNKINNYVSGQLCTIDLIKL